MNMPKGGWAPYSPRFKPDEVAERQERNINKRLRYRYQNATRSPEVEHARKVLGIGGVK